MAPSDEKDRYAYFRDLERTDGLLDASSFRRPVFSFEEDYTFSLLEPVFRDLPNGDFEKLSEKTQKRFCVELDRCDLEPITSDVDRCEDYIDSLVRLCSEITHECTGKDFAQWRLVGDAEEELRKAWRHFVRLISIRDFEWENLVSYLSDPHAGWNAPGEYSKANSANMSKMMRYAISQKLMVPLQMWALLLKLAGGEVAAPKKRSYV
ncbi:unnamed protein product [Durusdinium trenchii]|uniref:Uncharacterized protein n=2 Tax=Durusdinium trenchii TaxID=1381693 RepID=A0ABP0KVS1_9DINO